MFRRKDDKQDAIHHTNIKRGITSHFARTLKVLQQRHLQTDIEEPYIYSNDASNNLCNSLEAMFLHGLKDSVAQKITAYVGLSAPPDMLTSLNFWAVAAKFTHGDVVTQLQSLSQISTDIGLCRAWVRIALNDGLMESYLHSMVVDVKALKYFYHSYSFLRDHEQPGIMKNYLTGLMSLDFKLSYNSSVLNSWSNATLQLIGTLDTHHAPAPAVVQLPETRADLSKWKDDDGLKTEAKKLKDDPVLASKTTFSESGTGETQMFSNIQDIEEMKWATARKGQGSAPFSTSFSEGSSSSHVSCPDPQFTAAEGRVFDNILKEKTSISPSGSPALYSRLEADREHLLDKDDVFTFCEEMEEPWVLTEKSKGIKQTYAGSEQCLKSLRMEEKVGPSDFEAFSTQPHNRRDAEDASKHVSDNRFSLVLNQGKPLDVPSDVSRPEDNEIVFTLTSNHLEHSFLYKEACKKTHTSQEKDHGVSGRDIDNPATSFQSSHQGTLQASCLVPEVAKSQAKTYDAISATLPPLRMDPMEQDAILRKVLKELDKQADIDREQQENNMAAGILSQSRSGSPHQHLQTVKPNAIVKSRTSSPIRGMTSSPARSRTSSPIRGMTSSPARSRTSSPVPKLSPLSSTQRSKCPSPAPSLSECQQELPRAAVEHDIVLPSAAKHKQLTTPDEPYEDQEYQQEQIGRDHGQSKTTSNDDDKLASCAEVIRNIPHEAEETIYKTNLELERDSAGDDEDSESPGRFGNSLNSMTGWSSEIESKKRERTTAAAPVDKKKGESFSSLLRSYAPAFTATLDQVIGTLHVDADEDVAADEEHRSVGEATPSHADILQRQDSCLEGFEVLKSPSSSLFGQIDANIGSVGDLLNLVCPMQNQCLHKAGLLIRGVKPIATNQPLCQSSRMIFLFRVPREHGLSHQNFTCRGCCRPIGLIYGPPRLCEFDGGLYCFECHENNEAHIPSSIVFDWDFRKKKVCRDNFKFLQEMEDEALYDIEELNPKLYTHVSELLALKILRQQLCYLKSYLFTCSQKVAESLRQKVWPREHLYDRRDLYSVVDLLQIQAGTLYRLIKDVVKFASQHVYECILCSQKGFVCEICRNPRVIFPFEVDTTIRCSVCKAVYHKTCMTESLPCPKCERWGRRVSTSSNVIGENPEDYGVSPPV